MPAEASLVARSPHCSWLSLLLLTRCLVAGGLRPWPAASLTAPGRVHLWEASVAMPLALDPTGPATNRRGASRPMSARAAGYATAAGRSGAATPPGPGRAHAGR